MSKRSGGVLAIDYGGKNIGYAFGNFDLRVAIPKGVLDNRGMDGLLKKLIVLAQEYGANFFVLGLPLNMESWHEENHILAQVEELRRRLVDKGFEVVLSDELLSSFEADRLVEDLVGSEAKKVTLGRDAYAAQIILQRYFDSLPEDKL